MIDAVVFDFDGLIVDTESSSFNAWVETYAEYGCTLVEAEPVRPGVIAWLDEIAALQLPLAIASSSPRHWCGGHLTRLELAPRFSTVMCCDGERPPKPAPDVYLAACEALGVVPARALAIEDSAHGVTAAKTAGLWCVAVPGPLTRSLDFGAADVVLTSLADATLAEVLDRLESIAP